MSYYFSLITFNFLMSSSMNQGLIPEGPDPFRGMTNLAIIHCHTSLYITRILCLNVKLARSVAYLTPCILKVRRLFETYKSARFAISGGMAKIASFDLLFGQALFHPFNALERLALLCIHRKAVIFLLMTVFADFGTNIFPVFSFSAT